MAGTTNNIFVIIQAVDKATKPVKKVDNGFEKLGKTLKGFGQSMKTAAATSAIAIGILYGLGRAIEAIGERAEKLGRSDVSKSIEAVKTQFQEFLDQIATTTLPGGSNVFDVVKMLADGLVVAMREVGVVVEIASAGFRGIVTDILRLSGVIAELTGFTTLYTQAWRDAEIAQIKSNLAMRIGVIWEGKLTESVEKTTKRVAAQKKIVKSLSDEWNKMWARSEAIRSGDALALAGMMGGGKGGGGGTRGGNRAPGERSAKDKGNVTVVIGGEVIDGRVRKVIRDEMIKPVIKKTGVKGK